LFFGGVGEIGAVSEITTDLQVDTFNLGLDAFEAIFESFGLDDGGAFGVARAGAFFGGFATGVGGPNSGRGFSRAGSPWSESPLKRGKIIEDLVGKNTPNGFKTIDRWQNGTVTSIKTIDLNAKTYTKAPRAIYSKLKGYVDAVADYPGNPQHPGVMNPVIDPKKINVRALDLVTPLGSGSPAQLAEIRRLIEYAGRRGVRVNHLEIP